MSLKYYLNELWLINQLNDFNPQLCGSALGRNSYWIEARRERKQLKIHQHQLQNITQILCLFAVKTSCWCVPTVCTLHPFGPLRPQTDSSCLTAVNHHLSCHSIQLQQLDCLWSWPRARNTRWATNLKPSFVLSEAFHLVVLITVWYPRLSVKEKTWGRQKETGKWFMLFPILYFL